ncbi:MAG: hypothetical protein A2469_01040 [Candidatus Magasanikbacteria bacterium RIFOXYC2_FULL_40_16]|uniref:Uncharacterized protein n=2 Tax=Candidatus Magasanikiibacteriota TaxID=1752731 RepID=A0A1F6P150_9BACT|nr:MAG: hypothetical protein A2301_03415 [Candidatus Magasanikbacteria bacterium RIFOXYB2_FULL_40_13]OGH87716.1 MAG: hypothetical protein A2206_00980 [Candidatus Magasanikbacteria bacterium RIFOXYA1_FULL_40_8]OGH89896.1 MAG: hypothetical protein A2469_01040 [Candidatus Magasanikbacteria bacterium RIFOXYC2_FULL_40_16]
MNNHKMEEGSGESAVSAGGFSKISKTTKILILVLVVTIIALGTAMYFMSKRLDELKTNPQKVGQEELESTLEMVGKIMVLPVNEQPTLATVTDLAPLKDQPFFANAKIGDKVLLYTASRKAILYDPVANKIVEVAPINLE